MTGLESLVNDIPALVVLASAIVFVAYIVLNLGTILENLKDD